MGVLRQILTLCQVKVRTINFRGDHRKGIIHLRGCVKDISYVHNQELHYFPARRVVQTAVRSLFFCGWGGGQRFSRKVSEWMWEGGLIVGLSFIFFHFIGVITEHLCPCHWAMHSPCSCQTIKLKKSSPYITWHIFSLAKKPFTVFALFLDVDW